jgi:hypothetical protein
LLENLALRQQILVLRRDNPRPPFSLLDRAFWVVLYRKWENWRRPLALVKPETVIAWHRQGWRLWWRWKSRPKEVGRPRIPHEVIELIRRMSRENPTWGAPRINGELMKLGYWVSESTVARYMINRRGRPTQNWKTFIRNHLSETAARFIILDRDKIYGEAVQEAITNLGVEALVISARSPWQNGYCERMVGTIKRESLNHMILLGRKHTFRVLKRYFEYYHEARTHLGLEKDTPVPRKVEPPCLGPVKRRPMVGGLHSRYYRRAA